jgi:hypothetical protein
MAGGAGGAGGDAPRDPGIAYEDLTAAAKEAVDVDVRADLSNLVLVVGNHGRLLRAWKKLPPGRRRLIIDAPVSGRFVAEAAAAWRQFLAAQKCRDVDERKIGRIVDVPRSVWDQVASYLTRAPLYATERVSRFPRVPPIPCDYALRFNTACGMAWRNVRAPPCRKTWRYERATANQLIYSLCPSCVGLFANCIDCRLAHRIDDLFQGVCVDCDALREFDGAPH